jgi:DMSO/TMAO reductase YedYZ heme-binding membrane subunit
VNGILASSGPTALWYLARGSGVVAMVLLTAAVVMGIMTSVRWSSPRWPRFVVEFLHRNVALLTVVFLVIHIATVVLDGFAPIGWKDAVLPFASAYRPLWLGLGAVAFDLIVALVVTSLLRHRIGHRTWRVLHWFAYVCWPVAIVHGLGTGTDTKVGVVLVVNVMCVVAVLASVWWRLAVGWPARTGVRVAALGVSVVAPIALAIWLASGPLAAGWARTAGTPQRLLTPSTGLAAASGQPAGTSSSGPSLPPAPFSATVSGTSAQSQPDAAGRITIQLSTTLSGGANGSLDVELRGQPLETGGVLLDQGTVGLGPTSQPDVYHGRVTGLRGSEILADVRADSGAALEVDVRLSVDHSTNRVSGSLRATPPNGESREGETESD